MIVTSDRLLSEGKEAKPIKTLSIISKPNKNCITIGVREEQILYLEMSGREEKKNTLR